MPQIIDDRAIFFSKILRQKFADCICKIFLFGSRARGDAREGSDYDFAVILKKKERSVVKAIRELEVEFLNRFDILSSSLVFDEREWDERKNFPIGINIRKEGIAL